MSVLNHLSKKDIVVDALSRLPFVDVAYVDNRKKKLVKDVHQFSWLGVKLSESNKGGIFVHDMFESSLVVDVKPKQGMDPSLVELKKLIVDKKIEVFS